MSALSFREEALFADALAQPPDKRGAFLAAACGANVDLLAHLVALVAAHEGPETLDAPVTFNPLITHPDESPGNVIGRYKLLEKLGEGGCGSVWCAEQREPVKRRVALKIVKLGMDTQQVIARFEAERQALALMDHPNIAKMLDAGATDAGRPYFVMELVRGIPITAYCDENQLTTAQRLGLVVKVCLAIQHAHQKGVIHRDIKPSNVLITLHDGVPVPKVIDFGIAKATQQELTDKTIYTKFQQFIGTPAYMSPEQAEMSGLDIDTRSDIYSLGVLLYELVTGRTPFDARELLQQGVDEIRRTIREREPPRPSMRIQTLQDDELTTAARRRSTDARKLVASVRGDLDWIVMKCLEKDRTRRYETANGLAMDVERLLASEPVMARPPSTLYRVRKFVRRNRVVCSAAVVLTGVLVLGAGVSAWQAVRATRAEREQARLRVTAETAKKREEELRGRAEKDEREALRSAAALRRTAYVTEMNIAQQALNEGNLARARLLLNKHRPKVGEEDLRGFEWRYLWGQTRGGEQATLGTYRGGFGGATISPDGLLLAAAGDSGQIEIRTIPSGALHKVLPNPPGAGEPKKVRFSPDGRWLVAAVANAARLRRWDTRTWEEAAVLPGVQSPFAFAPNGNVLIAFERQADGHPLSLRTTSGRLSVWSTATWTKLYELPGEATFDLLSSISRECIAVSPGSNLLFFSGDAAAGVRRWDLINRREMEPLIPRLPAITACLAVSPDGILAGGDVNGLVTLWEMGSGRVIHRFADHQAWMTALAFSPDGKLLASSSTAQVVHVYNMEELKPVRRLVGHEGEVWALAFTRDARWLVTGSDYDKSARLWPLTGPANMPRYIEAGHAQGFDVSGKGLICWTLSHLARLDLTSGMVTRYGNLPAPSELGYWGDLLSPDEKTLVKLKDGEAEIWDIQAGGRERVIAHARGRISAAQFSRNGAWLITAGAESEVRLWNTSDWSSRLVLDDLPRQPRIFLTISPRGNFALISGGEKGYLADLRTEGPALAIDQFGNNQAVFSPDEERIAVGSTRNIIQLWDARQRKLIARVHGHLAGVIGLTFSADGRTLATCGNDNFVRLWSVDPLEEIVTLPGAREASWFTGFSPDGTCLAASTTSGRVQLWHAPSWAEIEAAERARPPVKSP